MNKPEVRVVNQQPQPQAAPQPGPRTRTIQGDRVMVEYAKAKLELELANDEVNGLNQAIQQQLIPMLQKKDAEIAELKAEVSRLENVVKSYTESPSVPPVKDNLIQIPEPKPMQDLIDKAQAINEAVAPIAE